MPNYQSVVLDIGAGDGKGSFRYAKKNPDSLVVAIDSSFDALEEVSVSAARKPQKGGAENLVCLYGNIKASSFDIEEIADVVRVYLPWGDLLEGIAELNSETLLSISRCAKKNAEIEIVINAEIWKNNLPKSLSHLGEITPNFFLSQKGNFQKSKIKILDSWLLTKTEIEDLDTTWSKKLMSSRDIADFVMAKGVRT